MLTFIFFFEWERACNNLKESCGRSISESEEEAVINIENGKTVIKKKNFKPVYSNW